MIVFYILLIVAAALIVAAVAVAFRSRFGALVLLALACAAGVSAGVAALIELNRDLPPRAHQAAMRAAGENVEVDAAVRWALADGVLTPSEYGQIAQIYREKTGRELNDLAR